MRAAIIDIGTNTINLLVADTRADGGYNVICSTKETARLGRGGINDGNIAPDAFDRGLEAIGRHVRTIGSLGGADRVVAIGTSAMRAASNAGEFAAEVERRFGFGVKVISGMEEAQMVFDGVKQVMPLGRERILILDIGGGSCEFIIANKDGVAWQRSFEVGMSRVLDRFSPSDPVTPREVRDIEAFFRSGVAGLHDALREFPTSTLVGTSGSFDTMAALVAARNHPLLNVRLSTSYEIPLPNFDEAFRKVVTSTAEQRAAMRHMDPARVELIVPGAIFINFVIAEAHIERLYQCGFALKQGAILQLIEGRI